MSVDQQVALIEEEERMHREQEQELARQQHIAECQLHEDSFDDSALDGDSSHLSQQTGSRKTRILPGPKDEAPLQPRIDEAVQLATQMAGSTATPLNIQHEVSNTASAPAAASVPSAASASTSDDGFTLVKGSSKGKKGKSNQSGANQRAAPYPGAAAKKSSS